MQKVKITSHLIFHIAFWVGHMFIRLAITRYHPVEFHQLFWIELAELPIKMATTYTIIYWLVPQYLKKDRYLMLVIWIAMGILIINLLKRAVDIYVIFPSYPEDFWDDCECKEMLHDFKRSLFRLIYIFPTVATSVAIYFIYDWLKTFRRARLLEKEKLEAELKYLKGQIHPHFLFNTLNNLYALTLRKSNDAPDVVLKLSELLSYMLYETNVETVLLQKEIKHIQHLIQLEKLRYGNRLEVSFQVSGEIENVGVAPLLLLPFVENAFKHGASETVGASWVNASLHVENQVMTFQVENNIAQNKSSENTTQKGIGLQNVKRRLALIYPNQHELRITENDTFRVWFRLSLKTPKY